MLENNKNFSLDSFFDAMSETDREQLNEQIQHVKLGEGNKITNATIKSCRHPAILEYVVRQYLKQDCASNIKKTIERTTHLTVTNEYQRLLTLQLKCSQMSNRFESDKYKSLVVLLKKEEDRLRSIYK